MKKINRIFRVALLTVGLAVAGLALSAAPAWACGSGVLCVDVDAPGPSPDGLTWTTAYTNVQDALAAANSGDEIWVAEGIYTPDVGGGNTPGDPTATYWLESGVEMYGGFVATETLRTQRDWDVHLTILSGDLAGDDTTTNGVVLDWSNVATATTNTYQILRAGDYPSLRADETAVLDGFTVTGGLDMRNDGNIMHGLGAGLYTYLSNPTLRHLVFSGNKAYGPGGGVYSYWDSLDTSSPTELTDVAFRGNSGLQGAGLYGRVAALTLDGCVFEDNATHSGSAVQSGGGLAIADGVLRMTDSRFSGNTAGTGGALSLSSSQVVLNGVVFENNQATDGNTAGGAMESEMCELTLTDVTFINNSVNGRGGGLSVMDNDTSPDSFTNISFIGNTASYGGGGLYLLQATALITNATFAGNSAESIGGGLLTDHYPITMTNGVFQGNSAAYYGGGLALCGGDSSLTNLTVAGNDSANGAGIINGCPGSPSGQLTVDNSIVYSNTTGSAIRLFSGAVTTTYSIVNGGCPSGATCDHVSDVNPAFVLPVVSTDVPTSTGNLRLRLTSPAIDAGNNDAVPTGLTGDADGNPRFVDIPSVTDTGNGTAPIVDIGAYEFSGSIPDLHAVKADDVDGAVAAATPFSWTVTISNTGAGTAEFASGNVLLLDNMPTGPTYGAPSVSNSSGLTGTVNCGVASSNLTCSANGGVELGSGGRFTVFIPVTPSAITTLTNPRSGAGCSVDPNNVIGETQEGNNDCNSDTVLVGTAVVTGVLYDTGNVTVTTPAMGSTIHGHLTATDAAGGTTPTGSVTFNRYDNATCSGSPMGAYTLTLVSGAADSPPFTAASFYYTVDYSGDANHQAASTDCTLFSAYQPGPTFTVNTSADDALDDLCSDIHCTLREAIQAANQTTGANTILFDVGDEATITLTSDLPAITDANGETTVDAETHNITVDGDDLYRPFEVKNNAHATLAGLRAVHGSYTVSDCDNGLSCAGGLKVSAGAVVTLTNSAVLSSTSPGGGGGIYVAGTLTMLESTVAGNSSGDGGGIINYGGTLRVERSTLSGNAASGSGGGIFVMNGSLAMENSTVSGNNVTGSASVNGGGAMDVYGSSTVAITNSTIVSNTAGAAARGGIWLEAGTLKLHNSIVAFNGGGSNNFQYDDGVFTSLGYNLSNEWGGVPPLSSDLTDNPLLGPLALNMVTGTEDNETETHGLLTDSPGIDAADPAYCPATDQRGLTRPQGSGCDIGAYEAIPDVTITKAVTPSTLVPYHSVVTYTVALSNPGESSVAGLVLTDTLPGQVVFGGWVEKPGSGLIRNGAAFTWTGSLAGGTGATFIFTATHSGDYRETVVNTAVYSGAGVAGSATASFDVDCGHRIDVQNTADSGDGSLRQALEDVCSGGTIDFASDLTGQTITVTSAFLDLATRVTVENTQAPGLQISGNNAQRVFYVEPSQVVTLSNLTIADGAADLGAGISNDGTLVVEDCTFTGNQATQHGGGIINFATATVRNSTFSGNQAAEQGGAILNVGALNLDQSTLSANEAGDTGGGVYNAGMFGMRNTIIAGSLDGGDCAGTVITNVNNLVEDGACSPAIQGDPLLSSLGDYGGSTETFALLPGSPAIDAGSSAACLAADQRGVSRPQVSACDIGAFESRGVTLTYGGGGNQSAVVNTAFAQALTLTVTSSAGEPVDGGRVIFAGPVSGAGLSTNPLTVTVAAGAVSQAVTANGVAGTYVVTAAARGNLGSPLSFNLTNSAPDIVVSGGSPLMSIADGDTTPSTADGTSFGPVGVFSRLITHTFTISNAGIPNLVLSGAPMVSITGEAAADFALVTSPTTPVAGNGATTFRIRFDPSLTGTRAATLTIVSNDPDESSFDFAVAGEGVVPVVQFSQSSYLVGEDGVAVSDVTMVRSGQTDVASRVRLDFVDGTATSGLDYTSDPITVTFPAAYTGTRTIIVPIIQDHMVESTENLTMTVASLSDAQIGGTDEAAVLIVDDDVAGFTVTTTSGVTTTEAGGSATLTVRLGSQPTAPVTVTLSSADASEGTVTPTSLVFSSVGFVPTRTVTVLGVDDAIADGDVAYDVQVTTASGDGDYDGLGPMQVSLTNLDDDGDDVGYVYSANNFRLAEGSSRSISTTLGTQPTAPVTITLVSTDTGQCTVSPASVTLDDLNWTTGVSVTISAVDDGLDDGAQPCTIVTTADTLDDVYAALDPADIDVTVGETSVYLPLVVTGFSAAPDLVVDSLEVNTAGVTVVVRNAGDAAVTDSFWVDVYFDPNPAPPPINQIWENISDYGAHWGVTATLDPTEALTLTVGGAYFFNGSAEFPAGMDVYAYVDSINYDTTYGNVRESDETNNVFGPEVSTEGAGEVVEVDGESAPSLDLPER